MSQCLQSNAGRWLTAEQAALYLQCSKTFLDRDRLTHLHGIRFSRLGRHIRYDRHDLDAYLEQGKAQFGVVQGG